MSSKRRYIRRSDGAIVELRGMANCSQFGEQVTLSEYKAYLDTRVPRAVYRACDNAVRFGDYNVALWYCERGLIPHDWVINEALRWGHYKTLDLATDYNTEVKITKFHAQKAVQWGKIEGIKLLWDKGIISPRGWRYLFGCERSCCVCSACWECENSLETEGLPF